MLRLPRNLRTSTGTADKLYTDRMRGPHHRRLKGYSHKAPILHSLFAPPDCQQHAQENWLFYIGPT